MKILNRQKGFTLLELLVVVAIIAILAAAIIINLNRARAEANDSRIQSDIRSISDAIQVYQNSGSPAQDLVGTAQTNAQLATVLQELTGSGSGDLLPSIPAHPASNQNYKYSASIDSNTGLLNYTLEGKLGAGADAGQCFTIKNGSPTTGSCSL
ncbi:prepilin-type N-terminal cleavage/methylation domain-containing protein [Candidatus Berkelbacteria bacterium]|nr:prepilin-type N-terminal cleavage/methylation domain-containing protein [Candidatus Berkelbacteria bacterium]